MGHQGPLILPGAEAPDQEADADEDEEKGEQLTVGHKSEGEGEGGIAARLPELFAGDAEQRVEDEKSAGDDAARDLDERPQSPESAEEDDALEGGFDQLRGVARGEDAAQDMAHLFVPLRGGDDGLREGELAGVGGDGGIVLEEGAGAGGQRGVVIELLGELDGPGHALRGAAIELAVDEIGEPPEEEADGGDHAKIVADAGPRKVVAPGKPPGEDQEAEDAAVAGHAAFPYPQEHEWIVEPLVPVVKDHAAQPAPEQDAEERGPGDEIAHFFRRQFGVAALREPVINEVAGQKGEDVGEAVPPGAEAGCDLPDEGAEGVQVVREHCGKH